MNINFSFVKKDKDGKKNFFNTEKISINLDKICFVQCVGDSLNIYFDNHYLQIYSQKTQKESSKIIWEIYAKIEELLVELNCKHFSHEGLNVYNEQFHEIDEDDESTVEEKRINEFINCLGVIIDSEKFSSRICRIEQ